jgi:hypothetical protein
VSNYGGGMGLYYVYRYQSGEWPPWPGFFLVGGAGPFWWRAFDARDTSQIAFLTTREGHFYYNEEVLDTIEVRWALARLDSGARPHVIHPRGDAIVHRYKYSGCWYCDTVMGTSEASSLGLAYSPSHELVLCFIRDNAPWIARRGLPTVPIAEDSPGRNLLSTTGTTTPFIVRGSLSLSGSSSSFQTSSLLDASGRKVMELQPGRNDIRHLAPGVYFVGRPETGDGGPRTAVRKVVVQK